MALQQSLTLDASGTVYSEGYFRIMRILIDTPLALEATTIAFDVQAFASASARQNAKTFVWSQSYQFPVSALDFSSFTTLDAIKVSLYNMLKTLPEFSGATDV